MKKLIVLIIIAIPCVSLWAETAGSIYQINGSEIVVQYKDPEVPFKKGEKLRLITGDKSVLLEVVLSMKSSSKCKLINGSIEVLKPGMLLISDDIPENEKSLAEVKILFSDMSFAISTYTQKLIDSETGKDAAIVLTEFSVKFKDLNDKSRVLEKKYSSVNFDDDPMFADETKKLQAVMEKFILSVMSASKKYSQVKDFQEAMQKISDTMKK